MLTLFLKAIIGAVAVVVIALLSKSKTFFVAGLVPLFPVFTLIAHGIVGTERSAADLRITAIFGLFSLVAYAAYLVTVVVCSERYSLVVTLSAATVVWTVVAAILLVVWLKVHPLA